MATGLKSLELPSLEPAGPRAPGTPGDPTMPGRDTPGRTTPRRARKPPPPPPPHGLVGRALYWLSGRTGRRAFRTFRVRIAVQAFFALASILVGIQLAAFYRAAKEGVLPLPTRPPGAEAYLPISGLMGILDWMYQGTLNAIHPAATVLVLVALALALLARKSFCSWMCPVGFLSELLARFGRWSFGRNFRPWKWVDIPLRSLKYLLLAFFLSAILAMGAEGLQAFIQSPYNRVAEVKMGLFFVNLSRTGTMVLGVLVLASIFVKGAWCRYACPYGALLGLVSWISPTRITRNADACVDCGLCDKACMARLNVSKAGAAGAWSNGITDQEYMLRIQDIDSPAYGHPGR